MPWGSSAVTMRSRAERPGSSAVAERGRIEDQSSALIRIDVDPHEKGIKYDRPGTLMIPSLTHLTV